MLFQARSNFKTWSAFQFQIKNFAFIIPFALFFSILTPRCYSADDIIKEYWPSGKIKSEEPTVNGKREGLAHYWWENGRPYAAIPWKNGEKDGSFSLYREDGSIEQELTYRDGKLDGICKWYYENGQVRDEAEYHDNLANGRVAKYLQDGTLKYEAIYRNGKFEKYIREESQNKQRPQNPISMNARKGQFTHSATSQQASQITAIINLLGGAVILLFLNFIFRFFKSRKK